jgi:hypothetical protein
LNLRRILDIAAVLIASSSIAIAQQPDPLATRNGWELGAQVASYDYLEPDFAELSGTRLGLSAAWTLSRSGLFEKFDVRASYGRLKYQGSGTMTGVPDLILEARAVAGMDWIGTSASLSPYLGLGYRYLYDDLRGYGSTGAAGYRRYSNYVYAPVGFTARFRLGNGWVLAPTLEADVFLQGKQKSKLSDTGLGYIDVTNHQNSGRGHRAAFMVEKDKWAFGIWTHYWHISDSDVQFSGVVGGVPHFGQEPENYTRESGLELRYRF